jgi:hypothetical protein
VAHRPRLSFGGGDGWVNETCKLLAPRMLKMKAWGKPGQSMGTLASEIILATRGH